MTDIKAEMSEWIEEHIKCVSHTIKSYKKPYTEAQLVRMKGPCSQLKILFDFVDRFNIDIDYKVYDKYREFADINF
jgi:hypothetical protein